MNTPPRQTTPSRTVNTYHLLAVLCAGIALLLLFILPYFRFAAADSYIRITTGVVIENFREKAGTILDFSYALRDGDTALFKEKEQVDLLNFAAHDTADGSRRATVRKDIYIPDRILSGVYDLEVGVRYLRNTKRDISTLVIPPRFLSFIFNYMFIRLLLMISVLLIVLGAVRAGHARSGKCDGD